MNENYDKAFDILMELEGYRSNDKDDSGKLTIWGITERWWPEVINQIKNLPPEESKKIAKDFYFKNYWLPNKCDARQNPDDTITFTIAVNNGMRQYDADTWEGDLLGSVEKYLAIVDKNPSQMKFFKGWIRRVVKLWKMFRK